jgi:hypothetical protein
MLLENQKLTTNSQTMASANVQQQLNQLDENKDDEKIHQFDCTSSDLLRSQESLHKLHAANDADGEPFSQYSRPRIECTATKGMGNKRLAQSKDTSMRKRRSKMSIDSDANEEECSLPSFACPLFRRHPLHNMECACRRLTRIRDVRQHLSRHHYLIACSICQETLSSSKELTDHLASRSCSERKPQPTITEVAISLDIIQKLKDCNYRGKTPEEQWYEIWDTLFEDKSKPHGSHFLGTFAQETTSIMRDVWKSTAREVITSYVAERHITPKVQPGDLEDILVTLVDRLQVQVENRMQDPASCGSDSTSSISSESISSLSTTDLTAYHTEPNQHLMFSHRSWTHSEDEAAQQEARRASGSSIISLDRFNDSFAGYNATSPEGQMQAIFPNIYALHFQEEPLCFTEAEVERSKACTYPEYISDDDILGSS